MGKHEEKYEILSKQSRSTVGANWNLNSSAVAQTMDLFFSHENGNLSAKKKIIIFFLAQKMFQIKHKICTRRVRYNSGQSGKSKQLREP